MKFAPHRPDSARRAARRRRFSPTRLRLLIAAATLSLLGSCMSLDNLNQFEAEWDQKYAPGTGIQGSRAGQLVRVLATYEATLEQRRIAEQRAREAQARLQQQRQQALARAQRSGSGSGSGGSRGGGGSSVGSSQVGGGSVSGGTVAGGAAPTASVPPMPRRIAVEVPHDNKQGKSTVMLWDTSTAQLVGNEVYDLSDKPAKGSELALWGGSSAQYVGTGR